MESLELFRVHLDGKYGFVRPAKTEIMGGILGMNKLLCRTITYSAGTKENAYMTASLSAAVTYSIAKVQ